MVQISPQTILNLSTKKKAMILFAFFVLLALGTKSGSSFHSSEMSLFNNVIDTLFVSWLGRENTVIMFGALAIIAPFLMLRTGGKKGKTQSVRSKKSKQSAPPKYDEETQHLGSIYNATINEGFEWTFAHMDSLSEFYPIHKTLLKRGYPEIAALFEKMFILFCSAENVDGVNKVDLPSDKCYQEIERIEQQAHNAGTFEAFNRDMEEVFKI